MSAAFAADDHNDKEGGRTIPLAARDHTFERRGDEVIIAGETQEAAFAVSISRPRLGPLLHPGVHSANTDAGSARNEFMPAMIGVGLASYVAVPDNRLNEMPA